MNTTPPDLTGLVASGAPLDLPHMGHSAACRCTGADGRPWMHCDGRTTSSARGPWRFPESLAQLTAEAPFVTQSR
jgi:hypothetical protein